jgi:5-methylcytosine-specific restriction endonuclease McrA
MSSPYYATKHWLELRQRCLVRDRYTCTVPGCGHIGRIADHIETRDDVPYPTALDVLENLRTLCKQHDAQVKERGLQRIRKQSGRFIIRGCSVDGSSLDPGHRWKLP